MCSHENNLLSYAYKGIGKDPPQVRLYLCRKGQTELQHLLLILSLAERSKVQSALFHHQETILNYLLDIKPHGILPPMTPEETQYSPMACDWISLLSHVNDVNHLICPQAWGPVPGHVSVREEGVHGVRRWCLRLSLWSSHLWQLQSVLQKGCCRWNT